MWFRWLWISLLGAFICLDNVAVGQFMISRPICCGPLIGFIAGDVKIGLLIGTLLEIFWISPIPVGSFVLPDIESSCIIATVMAIDISKVHPVGIMSIVGLAICFSFPIAQIGQYAGKLVRRINNQVSSLTIRGIEKSGSIVPYLLLGIMVFYIRHFLTCFLGLSVSFPLASFLIPKLTPGMLKGLALICLWCPIIGLATVVNKVREKRRYCLFLCSFAVALLFKAFFPLQLPAIFMILTLLIIFGYSWVFLKSI